MSHERTLQHVWSDEYGYPRDGAYLDSHGRHYPGGHRLWRVTDVQTDVSQKQPYDPALVPSVLDAQAAHFCESVREDLKRYTKETGRQGVICVSYDAELFGHRWFEGPQWLYRVLKRLWHDEDIDLMTGGCYVDANPSPTEATLADAAWQAGKASPRWFNENTEGAWHEIQACESLMLDLAQRYANILNEELLAILEECARELLLMEASDWPILMSTDAARDYAALRCEGHINLFYELAELAEKAAVGTALAEDEREFLSAVKTRDSPFDRIDLSLWASGKHLPTP